MSWHPLGPCRQQIAMPAYREELDNDGVAELRRWVEALRAELAAR